MKNSTAAGIETESQRLRKNLKKHYENVLTQIRIRDYFPPSRDTSRRPD